MGEEWTRQALGDFVTLQRGHDLPEEDRRSGRVPILGSFGVTGWHDEARASGPGVTVGRSGASFGTVSYSPVSFWPLNTALYVVDFHGNDPRFAYYFLRTFDFRSYNSGSAQPSLNRNHVHPVPVAVPPPTVQRAIAHILGTLDDKIELNRRMSKTLGAIAQALFRSWFVDFDAVRARAQGRNPGVPDCLDSSFPASLEASRIGQVPAGWGVRPLGEHFEAAKGVSYKGEGLGSTGVPLHNLNSVSEGGGYKYEGIKYYVGDHAERHRVEPGDVIVANTEQGHDRLLIGYAAIVPRLFGNQGIASHHIYRMRPRPGSPLAGSFLCHLLNSNRMHAVVSGFANGTTVNMLPLAGVQEPDIIVPPVPVVAAFERVAMDIEHRREGLLVESRTLGALRDTLLPKLISGELRIKDAERIASRATA